SHKLSLAKIAMAEERIAEKKEAEKKKKMKEHFSKATVYYIKGKYARAIKEWKKVLKLDPGHELSRRKIMQAQEKLK
ncbi:MAG: tetratricopeptide repeat protein, partial [Elusimicrobiota bacterium]|nr:tetratricopeptide repeat protein [Elusimicrobiota bacterium]